MFFTNVKYISNSVLEALDFCYITLIPSLFPFMVISNTIIYTGSLDTWLYKRRLLILDNCKIYASEIIMGLLCGFVVGAKGICKKSEPITSKNDFNRAVILCSNAGIGFVIGCVGCIILNNIFLGIILYLFQILSALIVFKLQKSNCRVSYTIPHPKKHNPLSNSLIDAIKTSTSTIFTICGFNIFFTTLSNIIIKLFHFKDGTLLYSLIYSIFEFSKGTFNSSYVSTSVLRNLIIGFSIGFGGLCAHFQTFAECEGFPLKKFNFIFMKALQGILCGLSFALFCVLFENLQ